MKIKFANEIYDVVEIKELPGGVMMYGIEDEPGHIDWIPNAEVVEEDNPRDELSPLQRVIYDIIMSVSDNAERYKPHEVKQWVTEEYEKVLAAARQDLKNEYDGQAMLYVCNRSFELGKREGVYKTEQKLPQWKKVVGENYGSEMRLVKKRDGSYTLATDHTLYDHDDTYNGVASLYYIEVSELEEKLKHLD